MLPQEEEWLRVSFVVKKEQWDNYLDMCIGTYADMPSVVRRETGLSVDSFQVERVYTK
jgi:hypothetical protein